jgi:hypothetical protein
MNEREYEEMQESAAIGQMIAANLQAILDDHGATNVADLYRTLYKHTECGPWLSVQLHDGTWKHCHELRGIDNGDVRALLVGAIVEGSDADVVGSVVDLMDYGDEGDEALAVADFMISKEQAREMREHQKSLTPEQRAANAKAMDDFIEKSGFTVINQRGEVTM